MDPGPVKIFTSRDVPRLRYIAGILLGDIMGIEWEVITDRRKLGKNPVINYSDEEVKGSFRIHPHPLLFQSGIELQEIAAGEWKGLPVFFQGEPGTDLPFDIFAASFYLITRYEEYLPFEPDEFGRWSQLICQPMVLSDEFSWNASISAATSACTSPVAACTSG